VEPERRVPRFEPDKPCVVCDGQRVVIRYIGKDGKDRVILPCPACQPSKASER
jgi:hypothetical protein